MPSLHVEPWHVCIVSLTRGTPTLSPLEESPGLNFDHTWQGWGWSNDSQCLHPRSPNVKCNSAFPWLCSPQIELIHCSRNVQHPKGRLGARDFSLDWSILFQALCFFVQVGNRKIWSNESTRSCLVLASWSCENDCRSSPVVFSVLALSCSHSKSSITRFSLIFARCKNNTHCHTPSIVGSLFSRSDQFAVASWKSFASSPHSLKPPLDLGQRSSLLHKPLAPIHPKSFGTGEQKQIKQTEGKIKATQISWAIQKVAQESHRNADRITQMYPETHCFAKLMRVMLLPTIYILRGSAKKRPDLFGYHMRQCEKMISSSLWN